MEISDILKAFEIYDKEYKSKEIDAALEQCEEIVPHLIAILEEVFKNPAKYADHDSDYYAHIYAFMLLGHFKTTQAHDIIVDLFSLPRGLSSDLFGDAITGTLPIVLLRTCGGNTERIKELILNKNAYEYCRGSALQALSYAAIENPATRDDVLSFYQGLFSENIASPSSAFHDILATCIYDLYPKELLATVEKAYNEDLIHSGYIGYEDFTEILEKGKEKCIENFKAKIKTRQLDDIHASMSWWACFSKPQRLSSRRSPVKLTKRKHNKKGKKTKKKQSKASKKANRKKKK